MSKFEQIKYYYKSGLWSLKRVENAVVKGWITPEQYEAITTED